MTMRLDVPLSREDSWLSHILHGAVFSEMSPELCKGARAGNAVQNAESIGQVHRAPQAIDEVDSDDGDLGGMSHDGDEVQ